jgi:hypothetical protein
LRLPVAVGQYQSGQTTTGHDHKEKRQPPQPTADTGPLGVRIFSILGFGFWILDNLSPANGDGEWKIDNGELIMGTDLRSPFTDH